LKRGHDVVGQGGACGTLVAKVYDIDVLACLECGGRMELIAFIAEPTVAKRILDHLGLDSTGPPLAPARVGPPDPVDLAPAYDVADPVCEGRAQPPVARGA
jgi:hypothetical protein